jgi:flagellar biosynthesis protein FlhF
MMKVRSMYGSQAMIIETLEVNEGGLFGSSLLSKKMFEIHFMVEERGQRESRRPLLSAQRGDAGQKRACTEEIPSPASAKTEKRGALLDPERVRMAQLLDEASRERRAQRDEARFIDAHPVKGEPVESESTEAMKSPSKMSAEKGDDPFNISPDEFRALLGQISSPPEEPTVISNPMVLHPKEDRGQEHSISHLLGIRNRLLGAQLSEDFTESFMKGLDRNLSQNEKNEPRRVELRSIELLAGMIRTVPDLAPPRGECRAVMLIGPTGSGKTTSLAKLAARYFIMEKREISLYSLDHYRLAATEQLKIYANVMGVPFYAPLTPEEFREQMRRDGAEIMFIDTSGNAYGDIKKMMELKRYMDACEVRLEKHLVIAANTNHAMIEKILNSYEMVGYDKILLTKLDETDFIGAFVEYADKINRPFSYLTNGQDVPGDIIVPDPVTMAKIVLREDEVPVRS